MAQDDGFVAIRTGGDDIDRLYYLQLLGYVIVRQGMDQAMFLTKHYAVPVAWRRITIDYHNRLNKPAQQLYKEFVEWTKEEYLRA
ncbi:hypothetical protein ACSRDE_19120 [Acinetobacter baumannii]|uniref:hypothetical protein n=1 Tax=Acinetobacter baumannii TaxID=470 RepID=UPI003ED90753